MIVEYIRYTIEYERQREFENAYERASLKALPHCIQYELSHCVEEPKGLYFELSGIHRIII
jgi:hemoglobin